MYLTRRIDTIYPTNYTKYQYRGLTSIRYGIKTSTNVVAARVWKEILGFENSIAYLKKVGIDRENEIFHDTVSVSLGGLRTGVSPLEMADAYTPFVNNGILLSRPQPYTKCGKTVMCFRQPSGIYRRIQWGNPLLMRSVLTEVVNPKNLLTWSMGRCRNRRIYISIRMEPSSRR